MKTQKHITISEKTHLEIKEYCETNHLVMGAFVDSVLREYLISKTQINQDKKAK